MSHEAHESSARGLTVRFALLTLSDTRSIEQDVSGQTARDMILAAGHSVVAYELIRDDPAALLVILNRWLAQPDIDAIITNGGTGISARDQTIPTIRSLLTTELPGFGEIFRTLSFNEIGPAAILSRAVAGIANNKLLAALPGSTPAVKLALDTLLLPQARHLISELRK